MGYKQKLDAVDKAILANAEFLSDIVSDTKIFGIDVEEDGDDNGGGDAHSHSHSRGRPNLWWSMISALLNKRT